MKIDDQPIPSEVRQVWKKAVNRATPAAVRALASVDKEISTGYRAGKVDLGVAQKRIQYRLDRVHELPMSYRDLLAGTTLFSSLVSVLSEQALVQLETQWCDYFGRAEMVAAMLLDERESVRTLAKKWLPSKSSPSPMAAQDDNKNRQTAAQALRAELVPLLAHLHTLVLHATESDGLPSAAAHDGTPKTASTSDEHRNTAHEQQLVLSLRDKEKEIKHLRRESQALLVQHEQQTQALASVQRALETAKTHAATTIADFAALQLQFDDRVKQRVSTLLDERLLPWLRPAEALADQVIALHQPSHSLLEQAQAVLKKQAADDRQHGLRSQLRAELQGCQDACDQLELARRDALRPLPELAIVRGKLQARIQQIEGVLKITAPTPLSANPLLCCIEEALARTHDLEAVAALRRALQASESLGWLQAEAQEQAYHLIGQASSKIYAVARGVQASDKNRTRLRALPLRALEAELADEYQATLVVDGHNVLYTQTAHFKAFYNEGRPETKARDYLGQKLVALGQRYPALTIHLWFDGDFQTDKTLSANVREHYSGGRGTDRADQCIVAYLRHLQIHTKTSACLRAVVTADFSEAVQAERTGALVIAPPELMLWLRSIL